MTLDLVIQGRESLPVIWPEGLDFSALERDWEELVRLIGRRRHKLANQQLMRLEVLTRLAWGAHPLLAFLADATYPHQTPLSDLVQSTADWIVRHYPWDDRMVHPARLSLARTLGGTSSLPKSGGEVTRPIAGERSPASGPSAPDSPAGGAGKAAADSSGPVGPQSQ